jgi:oligopeptide/dipeptide ABC transporter ATP-binding protein
LDVTVQAQILDLIKEQQQTLNSGMILITHDLGVIAETCDDVVVMYGGRVVERASVDDIFHHPRHAYTKGLLASMPHLETPSKTMLPVIPGMVESLQNFVRGCRFCQRLQRRGTTTLERPAFQEVTPHHWVEACPLCVDSL